jgi:hypothetical protein
LAIDGHRRRLTVRVHAGLDAEHFDNWYSNIIESPACDRIVAEAFGLAGGGTVPTWWEPRSCGHC